MDAGLKHGVYSRAARSRPGIVAGPSAALVAGMVIVAGAARAQTLPAPGQGALDEGTQLETVVVTATKRSEDLQNVAGSVTAIAGSSLSATHSMGFESFAN